MNIEGNDALSDERLLEIIDVQPRRVYNRKMALDATKLIDIYRVSGRYAAVVELNYSSCSNQILCLKLMRGRLSKSKDHFFCQ